MGCLSASSSRWPWAFPTAETLFARNVNALLGGLHRRRIERILSNDGRQQNVLFELEMREEPPRWFVTLHASAGLSGAFTCASISAVAATPAHPGA